MILWSPSNAANQQAEGDGITPQAPTLNSVIAEQYRLINLLGKGSFASVYSAVNIRDESDLAAIKISHENCKDAIAAEVRVYENLHDLNGIPHVRMYVKERNYRALVMDLLGPSLGNLRDYCGNFSLKTVLMLADQMICRLASLHSRGYVHGDLKEDNFILGRQSTLDEMTVYLVDFGLAKKFDFPNREHFNPKTGLTPCGTLRYTSLGSALGHETSRRDDLESLGYLLIYLHRGDLPWIEAEYSAVGDEKRRRMAQCKLRTPIKRLCKGLPNEFITYMTYCRRLRFDEDPDYARLRLLFEIAMRRFSYAVDSLFNCCRKNDGVFDWTIRLKDELNRKNL